MQITNLRTCPLLLLIVSVLPSSVGCRSERAFYTDVNTSGGTFAELIDTSPVVVVAEAGTKNKVGSIGNATRPGQPERPPVQKYRFTLRVRKTLRGEIDPGTTISVLGYESENSVLIGPPQGICSMAGELGVYFVRPEGNEYRTMVDVYRSWIRLDPRVDVTVTTSASLPESIWRLLVYPYAKGLLNGSKIDFSYIADATGYRLGRAGMIKLLKDMAHDSSNSDLQVEACLTLNETHRGCGGEACLSQLLDDRSRTVENRKREQLKEELGKVPHSNALLRDALIAESQDALADWAHSHERAEIARFLILLEEHPDRSIRGLASGLLARFREIR